MNEEITITLVDDDGGRMGRRTQTNHRQGQEMKPNKRQIETLREFIQGADAGGYRGCRATSEWTNGSGRHVTKRATPVYCAEMPIADAMALPGLSGKEARKLHKARPRVSRVVVVVDRRAANRVTREGRS